jgi:hypothetical protein
MAKDRTSPALVAMRSVSTGGHNARGEVSGTSVRTLLPAFMDEQNVFHPAEVVLERDPESDEMIKDLEAIIDIAAKWDRQDRPATSVADRLAWQKKQAGA